MAATDRITMTMRELDRFRVIQDVADGKLKPWRAAERLRLTTRQVRRRRVSAKLKCRVCRSRLAASIRSGALAMNVSGTITMSMTELDRLRTIQSVFDGPADDVACRSTTPSELASGQQARAAL